MVIRIDANGQLNWPNGEVQARLHLWAMANKLIQLWQIEREREIGIRLQVEAALRAKLKVQRTKEEDGPKQWAKLFFYFIFS